MSALLRRDEGSGCFHIDGELIVDVAAELFRDLETALAGGAALDLDLSGVTEIDTAGLQLLLMTKAEARSRGVALSLVGCSTPVLQVLDLFNAGPAVGAPPTATPGHGGGAR